MMAKSTNAAVIEVAEGERQKARTQKQLRRRARQWFIAPRTQSAMREEILSVPSVTVFDVQRILEQLAGKQLNCYINIESSAEFRALLVSWVRRQAILVQAVRAMFPGIVEKVHRAGLCESSHAISRVLLRLPEFAGDEYDTDGLQAWATAIALREAQNVVHWRKWAAENRLDVYYGLWLVLRHCSDLGAGQFSEDGKNPLLEGLATDVWTWVMFNADKLLVPGAPIGKRLRGRAYWTARQWKTERIAARKRFVSTEEIVLSEELAEKRGVPVELEMSEWVDDRSEEFTQDDEFDDFAEIDSEELELPLVA